MASFGELISIKRDGSNGGAFSITKKEITFGSLVTCDVRLNIPGVEQTHCTLIAHSNSTALLRNSSTSNPVKVNGKPVLKNALLEEGDKFSILHRTFEWRSKPVKVNKASRKSVAICAESPIKVKAKKKRKSEPLLNLTRLVAVVSPVRRSIETQTHDFANTSPSQITIDSSSQEVENLSQNITVRRRGNTRKSTNLTQQKSREGAARKSILKTTTSPNVRKSVTFRLSLSRSCKFSAENTLKNHAIWNVPRNPGNPDFDTSAVSSSDSGSLSLIDLTNYTSSDLNSSSADDSMISEYLATPAKSFKNELSTSPNKSKFQTSQQTPYSLLPEIDEASARSLLSPFNTRKSVAGCLTTPHAGSSTKSLISFDTPATTSTMAAEISLISFDTPAVNRSGAKSRGFVTVSAGKNKTPKCGVSVESKPDQNQLTPGSQTKIPSSSSSRTKVLLSPKLKLNSTNKTPAKVKPKVKDETPRRSTKLIRLKKKPVPGTPILNLGDVFKTPGNANPVKTPAPNQNVAIKTPANTRLEFKKQTPRSTKPESKRRTPASGISTLKGQSTVSRIGSSIRNGTPVGKTRGTYFPVIYNKKDAGEKTRASSKLTSNFKFKTPLKLNQKAKDQKVGRPESFQKFLFETKETSKFGNERDDSVMIMDVATKSTSVSGTIEGAASSSKTQEKTTQNSSSVEIVTAPEGKPNVPPNVPSLLKPASKSPDSSKFKCNFAEPVRKTDSTPLKPVLYRLQNCCVALEELGEVTPLKQELSPAQNNSIVLDESSKVTHSSVAVDVSKISAMSTPPQLSVKTNPDDLDKVVFKTPLKTPARNNCMSAVKNIGLKTPVESVTERRSKTPARSTPNASDESGLSLNLELSNVFETPAKTPGRLTRNSIIINDTTVNMSASGLDNTPKLTTQGRVTRNSTTVLNMATDMSALGYNNTLKLATPDRMTRNSTKFNMSTSAFSETPKTAKKLKTPAKSNLNQTEENLEESKDFDATLDLLPKSPKETHYNSVLKNAANLLETSVKVDSTHQKSSECILLEPSQDVSSKMSNHSLFGVLDDSARVTRNSTLTADSFKATNDSTTNDLRLVESGNNGPWLTDLSDISETSFITPGRVTHSSTFNASDSVQTPISSVVKRSEISKTSSKTSGRVTRLSNFNTPKTVPTPTNIVSNEVQISLTNLQNLPETQDDAHVASSTNSPSVPTILLNGKALGSPSKLVSPLRYAKTRASVKSYGTESDYDELVSSTSCSDRSPLKSPAKMPLCSSSINDISVTSTSCFTKSSKKSQSSQKSENCTEIHLNETYEKIANLTSHSVATPSKTPVRTSRKTPAVKASSALNVEEVLNVLNETYSPEKQTSTSIQLTPSVNTTHNTSIVNEKSNSDQSQTETHTEAMLNGTYSQNKKGARKSNLNITSNEPSGTTFNSSVLESPAVHLCEMFKTPGKPSETSTIVKRHKADVKPSLSSNIHDTIESSSRELFKPFLSEKALSKTPGKVNFHEAELNWEESPLPAQNTTNKFNLSSQTPVRVTRNSFVVNSIDEVAETPSKVFSAKKSKTLANLNLHETELDYEASVLSAANRSKFEISSRTPAKQVQDSLKFNSFTSAVETPVKLASAKRVKTSKNMSLLEAECDTEFDYETSPLSAVDSNDKPKTLSKTPAKLASAKKSSIPANLNLLETNLDAGKTVLSSVDSNDKFKPHVKTFTRQTCNSSIIDCPVSPKLNTVSTRKTPVKEPDNSSVVNGVVSAAKTTAKSVLAKTPAKQPSNSPIVSKVASSLKTPAKMHSHKRDVDYEGSLSFAMESIDKSETPLKTSVRQTRNSSVKDLPVSPEISMWDIFRTPAKSTPLQSPTNANPYKSKVMDRSINFGALISSAIHTANDIENTNLISPLKSVSKITADPRSSLYRSTVSPLADISVYQSLNKSNSAIRRTRTPLKDTSNSFQGNHSLILSPREVKDIAETSNNIAVSGNISEAAMLEAVVGKEINTSLKVSPSQKLAKSARKNGRHSLTSPDRSFEMKNLSATGGKLTEKNASPMLLDKLFEEVRSKVSLPASESGQSQVSQYVNAVLHWNTVEPCNASIISLDTTAYDFNAVQTPIVPKDIFVSPLGSDNKSSEESGNEEPKVIKRSRSIPKPKRLSGSLIKLSDKIHPTGSFSRHSSGSSSKRKSFAISKKRVSTGKTSKRTQRISPDVVSSPETAQTSVTESAMEDDVESIIIPGNARTARNAKNCSVAKQNTRHKTMAESEVQVVKPAGWNVQPKAEGTSKRTRKSSGKAAFVGEISPVVPTKKSKLNIESSSNESLIPSQRTRRTTRAKGEPKLDSIANTETSSSRKKRNSKQIEPSEILVEKRRKSRQVAEIAEKNDSPMPTRRRTRAVVAEAKKTNRKASIVKESEEITVARSVRKVRGKAVSKTSILNNKVASEAVEESFEEVKDSVGSLKRKSRAKAAPRTTKRSREIISKLVKEDSVMPQRRKDGARTARKPMKQDSKLVVEQIEENFVAPRRNTRSKVVTETQSEGNRKNISTEEIEETSLFDSVKHQTRATAITMKRLQTKKQSAEVVGEEITAPQTSKKSGKKSTPKEVSLSPVNRGRRSKTGPQAKKLNRSSTTEQLQKEQAPRASRRARSIVTAELTKAVNQKSALNKIQTPSPVQKRTRSRAVTITSKKSLEKVASPVTSKTRAKAAVAPSKSKKKVSFVLEQRVTRSRR